MGVGGALQGAPQANYFASLCWGSPDWLKQPFHKNIFEIYLNKILQFLSEITKKLPFTTMFI